MRIVEARFAGGPIIVDRDEMYTGAGTEGVRVEIPGQSIWLFAHEAQELAAALAEHLPRDGARALFDRLAEQTARRTQERTVRRRCNVDDELVAIDG